MDMNEQTTAGSGKGMAVVSLILGIVSIVISFVALCVPFISVLSFIAAIVGIILAIVAMKKSPEGKGLAIAGLIISIVGFVVAMPLIGCALCTTCSCIAGMGSSM